jgi:anti-anti-sigma regulatory factor
VVIAGMTGTKRCDSWGAHALTLAYRRAAAAGAELWLAVPSPVLRHMLTVLGIMLPVHPSLGAALARAGHGTA